jgi:hypothetical protein
MDNIWYDADTQLVEVAANMPDDIKNLFEGAVVTENDMSDYYKPAGEELPEEFDMSFAEMLKDYQDNACCSSPSAARANMCGCGGSGEMPEALRKYLEDQDN